MTFFISPDVLLQLLIFGLVNGAILALNAIGVTVIYSTVRTLNLAHGDVFALTTVFVTSMINLVDLNPGWPLIPRLLALGGVLAGAILFGALLSVGIEAAAFQPFRGRSRLAPVIASLGISFILFQFALIWRTFQHSFSRSEHHSVPGLPEVPMDGIPNFFQTNNLLSGKVVLEQGDVFVLIATIIFVVVAVYLLTRTRFGRSIRAVEQNEDLARILGVNPEGAIRHAFAIGGGLAGAAAFVFTLYYARPFGVHGAQSGLIAFAAALLGGIGSAPGALLSGLLLGVTGSFSDYFLRAQWTPVLLLGLLIALLTWRRGGLLGRDAESTEGGVRDSVVLTARAQHKGKGRVQLLLLAGLIALPLLTSSLNLGGSILLRDLGISLVLVFGLNIVLGLAGVLDLGYAASFAIGGYVAAILTNPFGILQDVSPPLDFSLVLVAAAGASACFGWLKGVLSARLRGDYLAVGTLALGMLVQKVIVNASNLTGGAGGMSGLPPPRILGFSLDTPTAGYYLVLGAVLLAAFLSTRLVDSRTGRAWLASSEDETAALAFGLDTTHFRMLAFLISSAVAGVAGALYASTFSYVDSEMASFSISAMLLSMVILGGAGSVAGVALGTLMIFSYDKVIVPQLAGLLALIWPKDTFIGMAPDIRGTSFFNFGIVLFLTVLFRARKRRGLESKPNEEV